MLLLGQQSLERIRRIAGDPHDLLRKKTGPKMGSICFAARSCAQILYVSMDAGWNSSSGLSSREDKPSA